MEVVPFRVSEAAISCLKPISDILIELMDVLVSVTVKVTEALPLASTSFVLVTVPVKPLVIVFLSW